MKRTVNNVDRKEKVYEMQEDVKGGINVLDLWGEFVSRTQILRICKKIDEMDGQF